VIPSKVQVITNVGLEHTRWLGPTVTDIAEEKLAVVRDHATLVVGELDAEAMAVAERTAAKRHAKLVGAGDTTPLPSPAAQTLAPFQRKNLTLAAAAAEAFLERPLSADALRSAAEETRIPGRLEVVADNPLTTYDGAHNPSGAAALAEALPGLIGQRSPRLCVVSVLEDKDAAEILRALLPSFDRAVFTRCANPRALSPATLESLAAKVGGPPAETVADPRAAVERARALAGPDGAVVASGSIYLIADLVRARAGARASTL
jgi:dihydrofolate synthase / folylpolyglutamate synthase